MYSIATQSVTTIKPTYKYTWRPTFWQVMDPVENTRKPNTCQEIHTIKCLLMSWSLRTQGWKSCFQPIYDFQSPSVLTFTTWWHAKCTVWKEMWIRVPVIHLASCDLVQVNQFHSSSLTSSTNKSNNILIDWRLGTGPGERSMAFCMHYNFIKAH